jgi:hypothetical protein
VTILEQFHFVDGAGVPDAFETDDAERASAYAQERRLKMKARIFRLVDDVEVEDYTPETPDEKLQDGLDYAPIPPRPDRLCVNGCGRQARYCYRGRVSRDKDHTLCFECFRDELNRQRGGGVS